MYHSSKNHPIDQGNSPYVANIETLALQNQNFRTAVWTGCHHQMTVMCIPPCDDIGLEIHEHVDQLIRVELGSAMVQIGRCEHRLDFQQRMCKGDAVFIPAGMWHNIINCENCPLKLSVLYSPPNHPFGTVNYTKPDGEYI